MHCWELLRYIRYIQDTSKIHRKLVKLVKPWGCEDDHTGFGQRRNEALSGSASKSCDSVCQLMGCDRIYISPKLGCKDDVDARCITMHWTGRSAKYTLGGMNLQHFVCQILFRSSALNMVWTAIFRTWLSRSSTFCRVIHSGTCRSQSKHFDLLGCAFAGNSLASTFLQGWKLNQ